MFADVPTKTRISLRMEQKATVEYACDGSTFALSVRDSFGTLKGETVLRYLDKCLHSEQQIDRKAGGAGLGLYIISNAATQFLVTSTRRRHRGDLHLRSHRGQGAAQVVRRLPRAHRLQRPAGRRPLAPGLDSMRAVPARPGRRADADRGAHRGHRRHLALIGVVAYPRLRPPPRGSVAVTTRPPGASVEVDGVAKGQTGAQPLVIGELLAGEKYKITARREGYEPYVEIVTPRREGSTVELVLAPLASTLRVVTHPAGATLTLDGKEVGTTPVPLTGLAPGSEHTLGWPSAAISRSSRR
jgi:hypothetical protein